MAKNNKIKLVSVDQRILSDIVYLLGRVYHMELNPERIRSEEEFENDFRRVQDIKDRLNYALDPNSKILNFFSLFESMEGYTYVMSKLVKYKHVEEIDPELYYENYEYIHQVFGANSSDNIFNMLVPYIPIVKWVQDKQYFKVTLDEIYNKGYLRRKISVKKAVELAKKVFSLDISEPTIKSNSAKARALHPDLKGKIKQA